MNRIATVISLAAVLAMTSPLWIRAYYRVSGLVPPASRPKK